MAGRRKTWSEKLREAKDLPKTIRLEGSARQRWGGATMVVPAPIEVDALMKQVRRGKLVTVAELRRALADAAGVDVACPMTTGIFAWIAAHAAVESEESGAKRVTPWWRTLKTGGELNPKFPGGVAAQRARLEAEGHTVIARGARFFVKDFERSLAPRVRRG